MSVWRIVYNYEHPWDARYDGVSEARVTAETCDAAVAAFREDHGDNCVVQCVAPEASS